MLSSFGLSPVDRVKSWKELVIDLLPVHTVLFLLFIPVRLWYYFLIQSSFHNLDDWV